MPQNGNGLSQDAQSALNGGGEQQRPAQTPTIAPIEEALMAWVRGSYMIAALAPDDVREEFTQAQQSFSGMINNTMAKKRNEALASRKSWERFSMAALTRNRERIAEYGAIWNDDKLSLDEKMSGIREAANGRQDRNVAHLTASPQHFTTFGQFFDQMSGQQAQAEQVTKALDDQIKAIEAKLPPEPGATQGLTNEGFDEAGGPLDPEGAPGNKPAPPIKPYLKDGWDG